MSNFTRRDLLKNSIAASAIAAGQSKADEQNFAAAQQSQQPSPAAAEPSPSGRERLLLDFGWRFHLGHASDAAQDFGWGRSGDTFAKSGDPKLAVAKDNFDDSGWRKVDIPHDWAIELPFENDPTLKDHGF